MNPIATAHKQRIKALNRVRHRLTGEDTSIVLLAIGASGAPDNEVASLDGNWTKERIRTEYTGTGSDVTATYEEVFEIAADGIDREIADQVAAVRHGSKLYTVAVNPGPSGLAQFWRLKIQSVNDVPE